MNDIGIWHFHTLVRGQHEKFSYRLSPGKVIAVSLTTLPVLCVTSPGLIYFLTGGSYLIPFTYFPSTHTPSLWQPLICSLYLWVYIHFVLFAFYIPRISKILCNLSFSVWLLSLSITLSRSIHVINGKILLFMTNIPLHTHTQLCIYTHGWWLNECSQN